MYYGLYYKRSLKITRFLLSTIPMEMNGTVAQA